MDGYGNFINNYTAYTNAAKGMEWEIGRRQALKRFGALYGRTVLDFGCGPGTNAADLRNYGAGHIVGIDVSENELEEAQRIDPLGTYLHYEGRCLASAVSTYRIDAILASFSFCTIPNDVLKSILGDMRQLLAVGGELVIIDPNLERSLGVYYPGELHYHAQAGVRSGDHVHVTLGEGEHAVELFHDIYRTHADYQRLLKDAGFIIDVLEEVVPDSTCTEGWAELARKYSPFLLIKAH
jgi:SAM-dependent methyltransferase